MDILTSYVRHVLSLVMFSFFSQAVQESCNRCYNVSESDPQHEYTVSDFPRASLLLIYISFG